MPKKKITKAKARRLPEGPAATAPTDCAPEQAYIERCIQRQKDIQHFAGKIDAYQRLRELNESVAAPAGENKARRPGKKKRKGPAQFLIEAREREAAKLISDDPDITCRNLAKKLDCDASTVIRLKAWQNRSVAARDPEKGIATLEDGGTYIFDAVTGSPHQIKPHA